VSLAAGTLQGVRGHPAPLDGGADEGCKQAADEGSQKVGPQQVGLGGEDGWAQLTGRIGAATSDRTKAGDRPADEPPDPQLT
jgi:hypothetical protein